jgi:hypothetical protein
MGFGTAVTYNYDNDLYEFFCSDDKKKIIDYLKGNTAVGFNSVRFDNSVLLGNKYWKKDSVLPWENYDILIEVIKGKFKTATAREAIEKYNKKDIFDGSLRLDDICRETIGSRKTGHGADAPLKIQAEEWASVYSYNLNDVRLTRKLLDFIVRYGYVIDGHKKVIQVARPKDLKFTEFTQK